MGHEACVYEDGSPMFEVSVETDASATLYRLEEEREIIIGAGLLAYIFDESVVTEVPADVGGGPTASVEIE